MKLSRKTTFVVLFIIGLFMLYFVLDELNGIRNAREEELSSLQSQQATLDEQRVRLNMEYCGKTTDCSDQDIMDYQFIKY